MLCGKLSIPDNFYFSTVTGQNPGGLLILYAEKVSTESLSLDSINLLNLGISKSHILGFMISQSIRSKMILS